MALRLVFKPGAVSFRKFFMVKLTSPRVSEHVTSSAVLAPVAWTEKKSNSVRSKRVLSASFSSSTVRSPPKTRVMKVVVVVVVVGESCCCCGVCGWLRQVPNGWIVWVAVVPPFRVGVGDALDPISRLLTALGASLGKSSTWLMVGEDGCESGDWDSTVGAFENAIVGVFVASVIVGSSVSTVIVGSSDATAVGISVMNVFDGVFVLCVIVGSSVSTVVGVFVLVIVGLSVNTVGLFVLIVLVVVVVDTVVVSTVVSVVVAVGMFVVSTVLTVVIIVGVSVEEDKTPVANIVGSSVNTVIVSCPVAAHVGTSVVVTVSGSVTTIVGTIVPITISVGTFVTTGTREEIDRASDGGGDSSTQLSTPPFPPSS